MIRITYDNADEILKNLSDPFEPADIEWRVQRTDKNNKGVWVLAYIDNRAVMNRLDKVVGAFNWKNEKKEFKNGVVDCIYIKINDEWVTKEDGADATDVEPFKGSMSDSMKRSAVLWGIGRYLYKMESFKIPLIEGYKKDDDWIKVQLKDPANPTEKKWYSWHPPDLPDWALPTGCESNALKLNNAKDKLIEKLHTLYGNTDKIDYIIIKIDNINTLAEIEMLDSDITDAFTEDENDIKKDIVKGWNVLKYALTHQVNSMKKPENLGADDLKDCHDNYRLTLYRKHLRDNYRVEKEKAKEGDK